MGLRIIENNINDTDLLAVCSPLSFVVEYDYTGLPPVSLDVQLSTPDLILGNFKAIPYKDSAPLTRQFVFIADELIRGYMPNFEDFAQSVDTLQVVPNVTQRFNIRITDGVDSIDIDFTACMGSRQFGQSPSIDDVNKNKVYTSGVGGVVYLYFYNDNENNLITVDGITTNEEYAAAYNDDILTAYNDDYFLISEY